MIGTKNGKDVPNHGVNSHLDQGNKFTHLEVLGSNDRFVIDPFEALPSFRDVPSFEKQNPFIKNVQLCCVIFNFTDPTKNPKEKEIKRQTLLELVDYKSSVNGKFMENAMQELIKMVCLNLFRAPLAQPRENKALEAYDMEEEEPSMYPTWPHLQIFYEHFLRFVALPEMDTKLAKRYIDHGFILKLLDLFDSNDPRERDYLKTILHRIYGKFMVHRPFIRKSINNIFIVLSLKPRSLMGLPSF